MKTTSICKTSACAVVSGFIALGGTPATADQGHGPLPDGHAPAGVMVDHMHKAGEFMVGYRYMYGRQDGDILHGTNAASDHEIRHNACLFPGQDPGDHANHNHCEMKQKSMDMHMHMLDIMYAPTDWLTLMVMPQWMSMDMSMVPVEAGGHGHGGGHEEGHGHGTEGFGDTVFGAMIKLSGGANHSLHTSLMLSAPTGSTSEKGECHGHGHGHGGERCFTHYMMQLGSGTWDFLPSVTYTGRADRWTWGGQIGGVIRLEDENEQGYQLGNLLYATAWGSYRMTNWLSASVRILHTQQSGIEGHYDGAHNHAAAPDLQYNYGGRFLDIGFGLNAVVPDGPLKGHRLSLEWLEPVRDDVNGYQQEREGSLYANWSKAF